MPFDTAQLNGTDPVTTTFPVDPGENETATTTDLPPLEIPFWPTVIALIIIFVLAIALIAVYVYLRRRQDKSESLEEKQTTFKQICESSGLAFGGYFGILAGSIVALLILIFLELVSLYEDPLLMGLAIGNTIAGFLVIRFLGERQSRENRAGMKNLKGRARTRKGETIQYWIHGADIKDEYSLNNKQLDQLTKARVSVLKENGKTADEIDEDQIKKQISEQHPYPVVVGEYAFVLLLDEKKEHALEWIQDWDIDLWGEFYPDTASPELLEIAELHRVADWLEDETWKTNHYIPVVRAVWDDSKSKKASAGMPYVIPDHEDNLIAYTKAIGAEERHTAGDVNSARSALGHALKDQGEFGLLVESMANAEANRLFQNKQKLSRLDELVPEGWTKGEMAFLVFWSIVMIVFGYTLYIVTHDPGTVGTTRWIINHIMGAI